MDDQSLSRMRVCLQVLLRAIHARVHGAGRVRVREKDLREEGCGAAAGVGRGAQIFVLVGSIGRGAAGPYCDWHSDGSLSASGTRVRRDAGLFAGTGEEGRADRKSVVKGKS